MSLDVSSWFVEQSRRQRAAPRRHLTIGGSDYSDRVLRWPTLRYSADTIDLGTTTVLLSNVERAFQLFVDCDVALTTSCELALGFVHPDSGEERISLFSGAPSHLTFDRGGLELRLQLQGKTRRLTDTALGTDTESGGLDMTGSACYPGDLAWTLVTCYGGLSSVQDSANPDLSYAEWLAWRDANAIRDVRVKAYLTGEKLYQVLGTLAIMDSRVISFQDGRLRFRDEFQPYGAQGEPLPPELLLDVRLELDPSQVTNHFFVEAAYDAAKSTFTAQYARVDSLSQADFGRHSGRFSSPGVWFAGGGDARYLAEERVRFRSRPRPVVSVRAPLAGGLQYTVGEVLSLTHSHFGLAARPYRILAQTLDLEAATLEYRLEEAHHRAWEHQATVCPANLLVRTLADLPSGARLAISEETGGRRVHRTDGAGVFQPTTVYATAQRVTAGGAVLFGGPPSSGAGYSVLQRSTDEGSGGVVVASLAFGITEVLDIVEVRSGTLLASCASGGILRSTDAGSSWATTHTVSGAYQVDRFCQPRSGTWWGATGYSNPFQADGLYLWESGDDGASWSLRHTVYASGDYHSAGFYRLSDSAFLLAHFGDASDRIGVLRGALTSPDSIAWTLVLSGGSFAEVVRTDSGDLLCGFEEELTLLGGITYRSRDEGATWSEDARISKQGNVRLVANGDGTMDAFVSRSSVGARTDRYRNHEPELAG